MIYKSILTKQNTKQAKKLGAVHTEDIFMNIVMSACRHQHLHFFLVIDRSRTDSADVI